MLLRTWLRFPERLGSVGRAVGGGSVLHLTWVIPGVVLGGQLGATVPAALGSQPRHVRLQLVGAGVGCTGAVPTETVAGQVFQQASQRPVRTPASA